MRDWPMRRKLYIYPSLVSGVERLSDDVRMELERLRAAYGRTPGMGGMGGGAAGPGDPCGSVVVNLIEPISERLSFLTDKQKEQAAVMTEVEDYIETLDALEQQVIKHRYFQRLPWDAICDLEGYSRATAHRLHVSAVSKCKTGFFESVKHFETL